MSTAADPHSPKPDAVQSYSFSDSIITFYQGQVGIISISTQASMENNVSVSWYRRETTGLWTENKEIKTCLEGLYVFMFTECKF